MVDSQRLRTTRDGLDLVSTVAAVLAERSGGPTSVLAVTTYFPADVDSIARVFDAIEEIEGVERVERGALTLYEIDEPQRLIGERADIDDEKFVETPGLVRTVAALKRDEEWMRRVRAQHEILRTVAEADEEELKLSYLTSRTDLTRSRLQSLLNDFDAQGTIGVDVDEDVGEISYRFPEFDYSAARFERNMSVIEEAESTAPSRVSAWGILAAIAVVVLIAVILVRF